MRYSNTERLGVNESNRVFTKDINWIFRELSIADFGVDAIIEETKENDPTGRLLAAQIKSGLGNFHVSDKSLTYYVSNIHYSYWNGYVLPVILIAYLPNEELLIWQVISPTTLKKTPKKWKIDIPKNKILGSKSTVELTKILDARFKTVTKSESFEGDPLSVDIYEIVENVSFIKEASKSTLRFIDTMTDMKSSSDSLAGKIEVFSKQGLSEFDPQVVASINKFAHELIISARRIENENSIFSEAFGMGISAYTQVSTMYYSLTNDDNIISETKQVFSNLLTPLIEAQAGVTYMRNSISKLPKKYTKLKVARNRMVDAIDSLLEEYNIAETIIKDFIE